MIPTLSGATKPGYPIRMQGTGAIVRLQCIAAAMLLFACVPTLSASPTAQEEANGGPWSIGILAMNDGPEYGDVTGAHFVVTTEGGGRVGECTSTTYDRWGCRVDVPGDRVSLVWIDPDSVPVGYEPVENPIAFDPTKYETGPHNLGAVFRNVRIEGPADGVSNFVQGPVRDVVVIPFDSRNNMTQDGVCVRLTGVSGVACDDDRDGRIHFFDVPVGGPYAVCMPNLPDIMFLANSGRSIMVEPGPGPLVFEAIVGFRQSGNTSSHADLTGC